MSTYDGIYHPVEQPDDLTTREKEDAMGGYLMMFAAMAAGLPLPIINLIASLVYYFINKSKSRFVRFHTLQSLFSQLPTTLMNAGLTFWTLRIIFGSGSIDDPNFFIDGFASVGDMYWGYLIVVVIANILYFIFSLLAAFKARKGEFYYFIFFGKLAYHSIYKISNSDSKNTINEPPSV